MIFSFFKIFGFLGILGPPYCGIGATIRIGREIRCLPHAGYFLAHYALFVKKIWRTQLLRQFLVHIWICLNIQVVISESSCAAASCLPVRLTCRVSIQVTQLHTSHCTLHTAHYTLHNTHCTLHTAHCTLHTAQCTLHSANCTLHTAHCTLHNAQYTVHSTQCTLHTTHYRLHTAHCTMHTAHCTLHTAHCTLHTAHCTQYTRSHSEILASCKFNMNKNVVPWIGEKPYILVLFQLFFSYVTPYIRVFGKMPEQHYNVPLFSNPGDMVLILVESRGLISPVVFHL